MNNNIEEKHLKKKIDDVTELYLKKQANIIRKDIIELVYKASSGHPGGSLSIADIITYLYFKELNINPENPKDSNRDRLVLSKGHCAPALYSALMERGILDKENMNDFRQVNGILQGHPDMKHIQGIDMTTGSLGQGLSASIGMALAGKIDKKNYRVYCILGDGEIEEGQVWEASMSASHYKLDNLCVIVDNNNLQIDGEIGNVLSPYPIDKKFESFGFNVINIDGHSFDEIENAFYESKECKGKPSVIIAKTIKGKGVSFMENKPEWHGKAPNEEQYNQALNELKEE